MFSVVRTPVEWNHKYPNDLSRLLGQCRHVEKFHTDVGVDDWVIKSVKCLLTHGLYSLTFEPNVPVEYGSNSCRKDVENVCNLFFISQDVP